MSDSGASHIMCPNLTSVWKVMTIWISRGVSLFNFEHLDILSPWIGHTSEKLWPFKCVESFHCSISRVTIYFHPELNIRVKSYENLNFSRSSGVQFRASRYVKRLNWTSDIKFMTIWISRDLLLFDSELLDMWCAWIGHPSETLLLIRRSDSGA